MLRIFGRDAGFTALYAAYVTSLRCCIPESPFDLEQLVELLVADKRDNPSRYAMVPMSEAATWVGHDPKTHGIEDAYGHKKKVNIAEAFSDELTRISGEETTVADLTYELRTGEPDFLDKMVAAVFATMAFECVASGGSGRMTAVRDGCYTVTDIPDLSLGSRRVDVETMYDRGRCRPDYGPRNGLPIFLLRA